MLTDTLHSPLSDADITAFFHAELLSYLGSLREQRLHERIDGSLTSEKARKNRLEALVLRGMVEDGLREEMPTERSNALEAGESETARSLYDAHLQHFLRPAFNDDIQRRAIALLGNRDLTAFDKLQLRWAAVEARAAAHEAVEAVPLHRAETARGAAIALLHDMLGAALPTVTIPDHPPQMTPPVAAAPPVAAPIPVPSGPAPDPVAPLTPGVELITGRFTATTLKAQREQAENQPEIGQFDGHASAPQNEAIFGTDLFGTTVRMNRRSRAKDESCTQKLKTVTLFIYLTGVQRVTEIRQHHLDLFGREIEHNLPKYYWKSPSQQDLTYRELLDTCRNLPRDAIGVSRGTIKRHVTVMKEIIGYAAQEGHGAAFAPATAHLLPPEERTEAEKRPVFTAEQVRKVFSHPLWTGCKSEYRRHTPGKKVVKDHHFWVNLLLVYTGARRSEIAGLQATDLSEENGIPFISVRPNHLRGLKNRHSKRRIPLHPHLIEEGFLEFVEKARNRGAPILFPEAIPANKRAAVLRDTDARPSYDPKFGDALDHVWRECLERSLPDAPKGLCLHSLRGYVNDTLINLREADGRTQMVPDIDRRDLMGHVATDTNEANYRRDEKPLGRLYEAVKLLPRVF
ncbi:site-specific integrase [Rhodobacter viridis]|nr:hypothetical protein [Rhodobacter viridis]